MSKIVERTLDFLELFAREKRPLSLSDISRLLTIPVSSCHDVLQALQERGFIYEIAPRGGYYPTLRLYELGKTITENDPVVLRAELLLRDLRNMLDETVLLTKIANLSGICLLALESSHPLRVHLRPGDTITTLYATSTGLALLAALDDGKLAEVLGQLHLVQLTPNTPKTVEEVRSLIELGRERGYFHSAEYAMVGLTTLSAAFTWHQTLYVVSVAAPTVRLSNRLEEVAGRLVDACQQLEMRMVAA